MDIDANDVSVSSDTQEPTGDILTLLHNVQNPQPLEFPETDQEPYNEIQMILKVKVKVVFMVIWT